MKSKEMEKVLKGQNEAKKDEVYEMEKRIEHRVSKIVLQKDAQMKQEKTILLEKYNQYQKKISDQRKQLKEAGDLINKLQHLGQEEKGDNF